MVAENADYHLYTSSPERLDNFLIMVENILDLGIAEHIDLTFFPVIVDIGGEKNHVVPEISTVLHLELESVERISVIDFKEKDSLLLARLPHCGTLARAVLEKVNAAVRGEFDSSPGNSGLQWKNVCCLGNKFGIIGLGNLHSKLV